MDSDSENESEEEFVCKVLVRSMVDDAKCGFCDEAVSEGSGVVIRDCRHTLCNHCAREMIDAADTDAVQCLVYEDGERCEGALRMEEIKEFIYMEYYEEAFDHYFERVKKRKDAEEYAALRTQKPNFHKCLNMECRKGVDLEEGTVEFVCNKCGYHTCIKCRTLTNRPPGSKCEGLCAFIKLKNHDSNSDANDELQRPITRASRKTMCIGRPPPPPRKIDPDSIVKLPVVEKVNLFNEEVQKDWMSGWDQIVEKVRISSASIEDNGKIADLFDQLDYFDNPKEFECSICMTEIPPGDGVILKDCYHLFCKVCLSSIVEHNDDPNVKCPFQNNGYSCNSLIQDREIRAIVSPEILKKHIDKSIQTAELTSRNAFHCKTLDCNFWCDVEVTDGCFTCPNCNRKNCIKCKAVHENVTCQVYWQSVGKEDCDPESRKTLMKMIEDGTAMRCPNCRVVLNKADGCDSVICRICKLQICWATKGPRWGPKGMGDISGGCRCKVDGKLCHPQCRNCH